MTAIALAEPSLAALKKSLRKDLHNVRSSHISEAIAAGLGFRTHAALLTALANQTSNPICKLLDNKRFVARMRELGYPLADTFCIEWLDDGPESNNNVYVPQQKLAIELIEKRHLWDRACAVYAVPTMKAGTVFMRVIASNYNNDRRAVVVVSAQKFLAAWQRNPYYQEPLAFADERGWREDYKFEEAEKGFAHGSANPVPLALIGVNNEKAGASVGFTNGITRTIWLLANGATAFPIECATKEADALYAAAGMEEFPVSTVEELLGYMAA